MHRFNRTNILITVVLVVVVLGVGVVKFSGINVPFLNWIEKGVYNLISPVIEYTTGFCNSVSNYWNGLTNMDQLIAENEQLKEQISDYEVESQLSEYYRRENIRLRELLSFKNQISFSSLGARVIGYTSTHWDDRIMINRGSRDGIQEDMPVVTYNGSLVGRIEYVGAYTSQVLLANNPEFVVGGIVSRPASRAIGLVRGQLNERRVNIMGNISWNTSSEEGDIREGDIIVTSGLSNIYPKGIPIGKVISVENDNYGLSQKAEIELFMNLKTIEEVLVITNFEG
ncbi:MAG: rod shape-determining protein MreC [Halanaerobiales bacterium]